MSRIHLLAIGGIRSFNSDQLEYIDFYNPVTFIVGNNGTGKTTILESLRYVISGCLPPQSNNGKSFLSDPRLKNRMETKAAIKLQFTSVPGQLVIAERYMELAIAKGKEEFRKCDQVVKRQTANKGFENCLYQVAAMDAEVPKLLGVSKSIVENIILCHQEDAQWPFGDNATLKGIFDEIFDTDRLAKSMDTLKKVIKEGKNRQKATQSSLETAQVTHEQLHVTVRDYMADSSNFQELLAEVQREEGAVREDPELAQIGPLQKEIVRAEVALENLAKEKSRLDLAIGSVSNRTRESLVNQLVAAEFVKDTSGQAEALVDRMKALLENRTDPEPTSTSSSIVPLQKGKLEGAAARLKQLEGLIQERMKAVGEELERATESMRSLNIKGTAHEIRVALEQMYGKSLDILAVTNLDQLAAHQASAQASRVTKEAELTECYSEINSLGARERETGNSLELRRRALRQRQEEFRQLENAQEALALQESLQVEEARLKNYEEKVSIMQGLVIEKELELIFAQENLYSSKQEIADIRYRKLLKNRNKILGQLDLPLDSAWPPGHLERMIEETDAAVKVSHSKIGEYIGRRNIEMETRKRKEAAVETLIVQIEELESFFRTKGVKVDMSNPYEVYRKLREQLGENQRRVGRLRYALDDFIPTLLKESIKTGRCFLCQDAFGQHKLEQIREELDRRIHSKKREMLETEGGLQMEVGNFEQLRSVKRELKEAQGRVEERAALEKEIKELADRIIEAQFAVDRHKREAKELEIRREQLRNLQQILTTLDNIDLSEITENVYGENTKTDVEMRELFGLVNHLTQDLTSERTAKEALEATVVQIASKISNIKSQLESKAIAADPSEMADPAVQHMSRQEVEAALQRVTSEMTGLPDFFARKAAELNRKKYSLLHSITSLKGLEDKIGGFAKVLRDDESSEAKKKIEAELLRLMSHHDFVRKASRLLEDTLANIKLAADITAEENHLAELRRREAQLQSRQREFQERELRIREKRGKLEYLRSHIVTQQPRIEGSCSQTSDLAKHIVQDVINKETLVDLEACIKAMERSTVKFHSQKIDHINHIIANIWKITYQGTDIQSVEITFEQDANATTGKKNYNYQVKAVMADGRRMPMRGRCSAGQRLMASIVIRLALSEAFCTNCHFLFLDEPTVYLDQRHVQELADFLSKLVSSRMHTGFQLVVITHDAEFMSMFNHQMEYYFRISKPGKGGHSKIEKVPLYSS